MMLPTESFEIAFTFTVEPWQVYAAAGVLYALWGYLTAGLCHRFDWMLPTHVTTEAERYVLTAAYGIFPAMPVVAAVVKRVAGSLAFAAAPFRKPKGGER